MEHSRVNTAIAFSNSIAAAVLIPAVEKRVCLAKLKAEGHTRFEPYLLMFSAAVFLLIQDHLPGISWVVIDVENHGHERTLRRMLLRQIRKARPRFPPDAIVFELVGKRSRAHKKALAVFQKKELPAHRLRARDLLQVIDG